MLKLGRLGTPTCLYVPGRVLGQQVQFLYDTGASCTAISTDVWARIPEERRPELQSTQLNLTSVEGQQIPVWGKCLLTIEMAGHLITCWVQVIQIAEEAVLGLDVIAPNRCQWDWDLGTLVLQEPCKTVGADRGTSTESQCEDSFHDAVSECSCEDEPHDLLSRPPCLEDITGHWGQKPPELPEFPEPGTDWEWPNAEGGGETAACRAVTQERGQQSTLVQKSSETREDQSQGPAVLSSCDGTGADPGVPEHVQALYANSAQYLGEDQRRRLADLLIKYQTAFSRNDQDIGRTQLETHRIPTGDAAPVRQPPRRAPMHLRADIEAQIQSMLEQGIVEECASSWAAPIVIVKKKDGSNRICVDYRALNAVTEKDAHPLPRIEDSLDALAGSCVYSTLDMTSGYHQVEVAEADRDKTAFVTGMGHHLRYVTMPFGLCNAPSTFQRLMEKVLQGLLWRTAVVYLDDVVIYSRSLEDHYSHLEAVIQRFQQHNLKLKPRKCELFRTRVHYLGHVVTPEGVATDPALIEKVTGWDPPQNLKEVRTFLGLTGYYRRFVPAYGDVAEPLVRLTDGKTPFEWTPACQKAFEQLKTCLTSAPILAHPTAQDTFILDTDASNLAIGAVLSQRQGDQEKVIAYGSKALSKEERNYCVTRRELLAIVHFVEAYRYYLYGKPFVIRTDHSSLRWMLNQKEPKDQLARWIQRLSVFQFTIEHRPGQKHANADALSRKCFRGGPCFHPDLGPAPLKESQPQAPVQKSSEIWEDQDSASRQVAALQGGDRDGLLIGLTCDELAQHQQEDPDLKYVRQRLEAGLGSPTKEDVSAQSPTVKHLCARWAQLAIRDGLLKYRWEALRPGDPITWKVILPRKLQPVVMAHLHDLKAAGHLGERKTWEKARRCPFIWAGMRADTARWVRRCQLCQQRKSPAFRKRARMVTYQVGAPWERIAADIAGPFPPTVKGNKYVLVVQDYFTKWVELAALPDQTAETVATFLVDNIFARFGCCREFHSDQGSNFESRVMKQVCQLFGVVKTHTTPHHPRGDGMVERHNRTLENMLSLWTNAHQDDWDQHLALLGMAYRSAPHETTAETPNLLNLGREITLPVDLVLEGTPDEEREANQSQFAARLQDKMQTAHEAAREHMTQQMVTQKRQYDQNVHLVDYQEGQVVWLHHHLRKKGRSPKLMRPWTGPYLILTKLSQVTFRIQASPRSRCQIVHADRLKPCIGVEPADLGFKQFGPARAASPQSPHPPEARPSSPPPDDMEPAIETDGSSVGSDAELEDFLPPQSPVRTRAGRRVKKPDYLQVSSVRIQL